MSEPLSVLLKAQISASALIQWLDAPVANVTQWDDWRALRGDVYLDGEDRPIALLSPERMAGLLQRSNDWLLSAGTNRNFADQMMAHEDLMGYCIYDPKTGVLNIGAFMLTESVSGIIAFLVWARSISSYLSKDQSALAIVYPYIWGPVDGYPVPAALNIGPGATSRLLVEREEQQSMRRAFQPFVDELLLRKAGPDRRQPPLPNRLPALT